MKTLFALLTGVALGTATALWLAARRAADDTPAVLPPTIEAAPTATPVSEEALP